jgi:hypothetical protein
MFLPIQVGSALDFCAAESAGKRKEWNETSRRLKRKLAHVNMYTEGNKRAYL